MDILNCFAQFHIIFSLPEIQEPPQSEDSTTIPQTVPEPVITIIELESDHQTKTIASKRIKICLNIFYKIYPCTNLRKYVKEMCLNKEDSRN